MGKSYLAWYGLMDSDLHKLHYVGVKGVGIDVGSHDEATGVAYVQI